MAQVQVLDLMPACAYPCLTSFVANGIDEVLRTV